VCKKKLREQGERHVYALGFQVTTNGVDPNWTFHNFLIAYGGQGIVTKDGKLQLDDPKVKEAAIKALTYPATAYKEGFVPPSAINWNDADDNNAFHAKTIVMDLDGTISTEVAIFNKKQDYDDIVTMGVALKPVPSSAGVTCGLIPERGEECHGGQRLPQIFDPAKGLQRISENRARPQYSLHAVDREE
jgi:multiple sugar transport system substrate-binding protein